MSIKSRQAKVIDNGYLDLLGEARGSFTEVSLTNVVDTLVYLAALYKDTAVKKLNEKDRVSTGALGESIQISEVKILGKRYTVNISIDKYYKFVDQGVNGWDNNQSSPFSFKHYMGKSGKKSSEMVKAIRRWVVKESIQATEVNHHKTIFSREKRQSSITDTSTRTAIIISRSIRKKGLKATHFWSETESIVATTAKEQFAQAIKVDIINNLYGNSH